MASNIMTGARALVRIQRGTTEEPITGIFTNISYGYTYDTQPAYILGRYSAAAIDYTALEVVNITASGWRIVGRPGGIHDLAALPKLEELLKAPIITITITDRQNPDKILTTIKHVRCTGVSTGYSSRQMSEATFTFVGISVDDEGTVNNEAVGAAEIFGNPESTPQN